MRFLFSSQNVPTHLRALLPVIRAAQRAGHTVAVAAAKELGGEIAAHGLEHRPLIFACLSSVALSYPGMLEHGLRMMETMISALGELDCTALVAIGRWTEPGRFGPQPPHVHLTDHAPQKLLLECADLFVTHAGYTSLRESVRAGASMVTIPSIGDTMYSAACAVESSIAKNILLEEIHPKSVRQACVDVLSDPRYARSVRRLQRRMLALPTLDALITDLEELAARNA